MTQDSHSLHDWAALHSSVYAMSRCHLFSLPSTYTRLTYQLLGILKSEVLWIYHFHYLAHRDNMMPRWINNLQAWDTPRLLLTYAWAHVDLYHTVLSTYYNQNPPTMHAMALHSFMPMWFLGLHACGMWSAAPFYCKWRRSDSVSGRQGTSVYHLPDAMLRSIIGRMKNYMIAYL